MAVPDDPSARSETDRERMAKRYMESAEPSRSDSILYGAIDLGRSKVRSVVADTKATFLAEEDRESLAGSGKPESVVAQMVGSLDATVEKLGDLKKSKSNLAAVGIATPGPVNVKRGIVSNAPQLPNWQNIPLAKIMKQELARLEYQVDDVYVHNDANAEALGEYAYGSGDGCDPMVYVTMGTGIGGAIIIDGELYLGKSGAAGEVGHMVIGDDGPECACGGGRGHLESLASGTAIARMGRDLIRSGKSPELKRLSEKAGGVTAKLMSQAAESGDEDCRLVFKEVGRHLGIALASLVNIFNPEAVIIGGSVARATDLFFDEAESTMQSRAMGLASRVNLAIGDLDSEAACKGLIAFCETERRPKIKARAG